jgi:hypothetical protein
MPTFVVEHVSLGPETLAAALGADKGPGILVDSAMDFQILLLTERLATGGELALERLCPIVLVHVGPQTNLALKALLTPWEGAHEVRI